MEYCWSVSKVKVSIKPGIVSQFPKNAENVSVFVHKLYLA